LSSLIEPDKYELSSLIAAELFLIILCKQSEAEEADPYLSKKFCIFKKEVAEARSTPLQLRFSLLFNRKSWTKLPRTLMQIVVAIRATKMRAIAAMTTMTTTTMMTMTVVMVMAVTAIAVTAMVTMMAATRVKTMMTLHNVFMPDAGSSGSDSEQEHLGYCDEAMSLITTAKVCTGMCCSSPPHKTWIQSVFNHSESYSASGLL
jgi:hypothetical protein